MVMPWRSLEEDRSYVGKCMHFNTTFPQIKKADVNGENELPLYTYLKA